MFIILIASVPVLYFVLYFLVRIFPLPPFHLCVEINRKEAKVSIKSAKKPSENNHAFTPDTRYPIPIPQTSDLIPHTHLFTGVGSNIPGNGLGTEVLEFISSCE